MLIYLMVIIVLFVMHSNLQTESNVTRRIKLEHSYVRSIYMLFIILAALRYVMPGTDIDGYMFYYNNMGSMDWSEIPKRWNGNYVMYFSMCKAFSYTHLSYQFWFGFLELLYITGFARLINKLSIDKLLGVFLFFTIGLFSFSFNGLKQVAAMAFIWHAFAFFYDKKYVSAVMFSVIAFYCHKTSLFFVLSFALVILKNFRFIYVAIGFLAITVIAAPGFIFSFLANSIEDEQYLMYLGETSNATYTLLILYVLLFSFAYTENRKRKYLNSADDKMIMVLALISVVVQLFAQVSGTAFRLALYYSPFLLIMLSNNVKNKNLRIGLMALMTVFMLYSGRQFPYKFFWQ